MLEDLDSGDDIAKRTDALLRAAGAYGRYPTPVDDIVAARGLQESADFALDEGLLRTMPKKARDLVRRAFRGWRGALDRRERVVHISENVTHEGQKRFVKLHEVSHDDFPWQRQLIHADNAETLSPATKILFEQEANQGAAEMLFQRDGFTNDGKSLAIGTAAVVHLATRYGSSLHAAFRRYAETHHEAVQVIRLSPSPSGDGSYTRYEQPQSAAWSHRLGTSLYPRHLHPSKHPFLAAIDHGLDEVPLSDRGGLSVNVCVESLNTGYALFVLLWVEPGRRLLRPIAVRLAS
jgi:hypothetical protein